MKSTLAIVASLLLTQSAEEPAKFFKKFSKRVAESKELHLSFGTRYEDKEGGGEFTGSLLLAKENKARIEAAGTIQGKKFSMLAVSDGNNLKMTSTERDNLGLIATPQHLNQEFAAFFVNSSAKEAILSLQKRIIQLHDNRGGVRSPEPKLSLLPPTPGRFKMGAPETKGDVALLQVRYSIADPESGDRHAVALWMDKETLAPDRRTLDPLQEDGSKIVETYTRVNFEPKPRRDEFKVNAR